MANIPPPKKGLSFNEAEWGSLYDQTPHDAISVKSKPNRFAADPAFKDKQYLGVLCKPYVSITSDIKNDGQLLVELKKYEEIVIISNRLVSEKRFVWRGTPADFAANWIGD